MNFPLLSSNSEVEIAGVYFASVKFFGASLGKAVDQEFRRKGAADWFQIIRKVRQEEQKSAVYDDAFDPRFILKEATIPNSPVVLAIPGFNPDWKDKAFKLRKQINKWSHFSTSPTIPNLVSVIESMLFISSLSSLDIREDLEASLARMKAIENGTWSPPAIQSPPTFPADEDAKKYAYELAQKIAAIEKRPPVGSPWTGDKGTRKIVINKALRDVTENGVSIRNSLGPDSEEIVSKWLRYFPAGGEAKVAPDGAVMGFKKGTPYLIGWLGQIPASETEPTGFYLDHDFEYLGTDIRDIQSQELLSVMAIEPIGWLLDELAQKIPIGSVFNVTNYGHVVFENANGEEIRISEVHKDVWFPGQLPG